MYNTKHPCHKFSEEFKEQVIQLYLNGKRTYRTS